MKTTLALLVSVLLSGCSGAQNASAVDGGADADPVSTADGATAEDGSQSMPVDMALAAVDLAPTADLLPEPTCGVAQKPCCGGTTDADGGVNRGGTCDATSACYPFSTGSMCKACGGDDEICCTTGTACTAPGDLCRPTDPKWGVYAPTCFPCGGQGQVACAAPLPLCWDGAMYPTNGKCL